MAAAGRSPYTIRNARAVLRRALTEAESWGLISRNVAKLVTLPRIPTEEVEQVMSNGETFSLFGGISSLFGLAMSALGGYVCIRVSNGVDLTNPIVLGVITFLIAVLLAWDAYDLVEFLGLTVLSFAATLWGGRAAIQRRKKAAAFEA